MVSWRDEGERVSRREKSTSFSIVIMQPQQYWSQPYAQQAAYAPAYANQAYAQQAAYAQPQQTAGTATYQYAQAAQPATYNPYAQAFNQQQQQAAYNYQQTYQPGFRTAGGYDHADYYGHAFDNRSAGHADSRSGGARHLNPKARMWQHKVTNYAKAHGITLKQAMIRLKGTGVGSRSKRRSRSRSRSRQGGDYEF